MKSLRKSFTQKRTKNSQRTNWFAILAFILALGAMFASCELQGDNLIDNPIRIPVDNPTDDIIIPDGSISISSSVEMAKIGIDEDYPLNGAYHLTQNITLSNWTPIGNGTSPFTGKFDGNGKTISLNSINLGDNSANTFLGIFGYVKGASDSNKAEIKNMSISSALDATSTSTANGHSIGLAAGYLETAVIDKITLSGNLKFYSERTVFAGGAAGYITGSGTLVKNVNSTLNMTINPGSGGTAPVSGYDYIGGIVGRFNNGAGIENCHNKGNVIADNMNNTASGQVFAGGVTGGSTYAMNATYHGYVIDSSSTGNVTGKCKGMWTFAGGIAATIVGGTVNDKNATTRIERCFATGTVSVEGTNSGNPYIGGIVGYNYFGALVSQSYFNGTVIAAKSGDYTGGIAGYNSQTAAPGNSRIEDCWSAGTIKGFNNAGGIVGQNQVNTFVRRCYSTMIVQTTNNSNSGVGGITGLHSSTNADAVTSCVALNPSITAGGGNNVQRVTQNGTGVRSNNYALASLVPTTSGTYTERKGLTESDGADIPSNYLSGNKPTQTFYQSVLNWDFANVWKMGSNGYPKLKWQN